MLMDVILTQRAVPLEAAAREEELLLIWRVALHEFNPNLHAVNGVRRLNIQWDCPACQGLGENLHDTLIDNFSWGRRSGLDRCLRHALLLRTAKAHSKVAFSGGAGVQSHS